MRVAILQITLGSRISGFHLLLKCGPLQIQSQISRANDCITMPGLTRLPETGPLPTERKAIDRATRRAAGSKPLNAGSVCGPTEARAFPPGRGSPQHRALKDADPPGRKWGAHARIGDRNFQRAPWRLQPNGRNRASAPELLVHKSSGGGEESVSFLGRMPWWNGYGRRAASG